ncbi:hypothetical protein GCM10010218_34140 [Streptomyces mashuensis]|uniref:DUF2992 family protein n=1 Tax=Streptomyces mashuensis TaxID=33904 RepID=A0A919B457_9ACTN|nr:YjdF family protein [Streptomyces mashuensis]GHF49863.1 hypothetical protein GCM10010218_34140 [Streptomyces mashuensis]
MPSTFSVFFDDPFWVGVLEVHDGDGVRAARHVFGGEPTGPELEEFVRRDFGPLLDTALAAPVVTADRVPRPRRGNAKRAARAAAREQAGRPVTTAAQDALREAFERTTSENRAAAKRRQAAEAEQRRALARAKARARHRGR